MEIITGISPEIIAKAQAIRYQVFTVEQGIPKELDLDGLDATSVHTLVTENGNLVATSRLTIEESGFSVLARIAVLKPYRRLGVAAKVVKTMMEYARSKGVSIIEIHAHNYLRNYYEKFGFVFSKEAEIVGEHQLIEMHYYFEDQE